MARKQFLLRIDPELWNELEKWAADDLRSVNAQVEWSCARPCASRGALARTRIGPQKTIRHERRHRT
jgi:hypothetical protein